MRSMTRCHHQTSRSRCRRRCLHLPPGSVWCRQSSPTLGLMAVTGLAVWGLVRPDPPLPRSSVRLAIPRPPETTGFPGYGSLVDFSPDGQTLAFVACWSGCSGRELRAYLRPLGQREAVPVPNSEGTYAVFFSPDGQWLGLNAGAGLKKVSLAGGPPVTLFDGPVLGASWGPDDTVVFGGRDAGLWRVSADGGEAELLASADGEIRWPHALPEGRAVLYTIWRGELETSEIAVLSLESGETKILVDGTSPRYASTGHLLFGRGGVALGRAVRCRAVGDHRLAGARTGGCAGRPTVRRVAVRIRRRRRADLRSQWSAGRFFSEP